MTWAREGSSPRLGRSTMQFPSDKHKTAGANFCGRRVFSSCYYSLSHSYLLVSKSMCSNKSVGFVFVKDESGTTLKNRLTHHPHSRASPFYKELRKRPPHPISRAPWKRRSWAWHSALAPSHTSSLIQPIAGQCVILTMLPTDSPRKSSSQKGFMPRVAVDYRAPLAPKLPPSTVA